MKFAENIQKLNFGLNTRCVRGGGFGIPWNYKATEIARKLKTFADKGLELPSELLKKIEPWAQFRMSIAEDRIYDPISFCWRLPGWDQVFEHWNDADIHVLCGGNRSGKSHGAATLCDYAMLSIPKARVHAFHQDEELSVEIGQRLVYSLLPLRFDDVPIKDSIKVKDYNDKTGFAGNKFLIPPLSPIYDIGSIMNFWSYAQYLNNPNQKFEGLEGDLFWLDEQGPYQLLKTLLARQSTRPKKIIVTATMLDGDTEMVRVLIDKARTVKWKHSEYLGEKLPVMQRSVTHPNCLIHYLWTEYNPFIDIEEMRRNFQGFTLEEKKTRLYGIPPKRSMCRFPKFHPDFHVVPEEKIPTKNCTNYLICDPAGEKNWFFIWVRVDSKGRHYVYREWPSLEDYGLWALPSADGAMNKWKGSPGPAQKSLGLGFEGYAKMLDRQEAEDETIAEEFMDCRFANKKITTDTGTTDIMELMSLQGRNFQPTEGNNNIGPGIQLVNSMFEFDVTKPISDDNTPMLFISERCGNVIDCIQKYTGMGGSQGKMGYEENFKDPIDCLRYMAMQQLCHITGVRHRKGGSW